MNRTKRWIQVGMALAAACAPGIAHADVVWPALFLEPRLLSVPVVAMSLLIEAAALHFAFGMRWARAGLVAVAVNTLSAALGFLLIPLAGIVWEIFPGLLLYKFLKMGTFNPLTWAATFVLAVGVTTCIEVACLRVHFNVPWDRRSWALWLGANAITVGLAFASFAIEPTSDTHLYRLWLVR